MTVSSSAQAGDKEFAHPLEVVSWALLGFRYSRECDSLVFGGKKWDVRRIEVQHAEFNARKVGAWGVIVQPQPIRPETAGPCQLPSCTVAPGKRKIQELSKASKDLDH